MKMKVSVIVPIYKIEKEYLERCLDSLVKQTLKEIEIILVNDASPDSSGVIMERYKEKYDNIITIYLEQSKGPGGARNAGVDIASGKYISFVDSDDWIEPDYLEKLYNACEESGSDVAYSPYKAIDESGKELGMRMFWPIEFSGELTSGKKKGIMNKTLVPWGKIYSLALWRSIGLDFPNHLRYQDSVTISMYMLHAKRCCCVRDAYYWFLERKGSVTHTRNVGLDDLQKTALIFQERIKKYGLYDEYQLETDWIVIKRYYITFLTRCVQMYDEIPYARMEQARNDIRKWYPNFENNPYYWTALLEDRLRVQMNEISPYTCAIWEQKFKNVMAQDETFYSSIYLQFYEERKDIIDRIVMSKKHVGLYGDRHKKNALSYFLNKYYSLKVTDYENGEALKNADLMGIDIVVGVNPSASLVLHNMLATMGCHTKVVNFEDILYGYIEEESI